MTKIAVITDTHANLPALDAALDAIRELGCDATYHTGDAVGAGPFPAEVLDRLLHTPDMHLVMDNHDELCAFGIQEPRPVWMDDLLAANSEWTYAHVGPEHRAAMTSWPYEIIDSFFGYRIAFLHYPLDTDGDGFAAIIPDPSGEELDRLFAGQQANLIFYGHHHPPADHTGQARYINPGSLGCGPNRLARFTVVDVARSGVVEVRHHAVSYDRTPLHEALIHRDVPDHGFLRRTFFP